jgi:mRNA-degrading endonuclease toxin of MazEF toxin-antitoxin module
MFWLADFLVTKLARPIFRLDSALVLIVPFSHTRTHIHTLLLLRSLSLNSLNNSSVSLCEQSAALDRSRLATERTQVQVQVQLRLTVSQSVRPGVEPHFLGS